tara:strand:+ start:2224 stop:2418 length:195 start_codon:yes stop_codon:yes gene_type:complete
MPSEAYKNALRRLNIEEDYRQKPKKPSSNKIKHDFFKNATRPEKKPEKKKGSKKKCYSLCDYLF